MMKLKKETVTEEFDQEGKMVKRIILREYEEQTESLPIIDPYRQTIPGYWPIHPYRDNGTWVYPVVPPYEITCKTASGH